MTDNVPGQQEKGCICQEQHRRGYCTEPGCPYGVSAAGPLTGVIDDPVGAICTALCQSRVFEIGQGTCALTCMDQLGDARKKGCYHAKRVHDKVAHSILEALAAKRHSPAGITPEVENYRLALAWISKQSTDEQSRELAETALNAFPSTESKDGV